MDRKEYFKNYYEKNKEKISQQQAEYCKENKETRNEKRRNYRATNPEKHKESEAKYKKEHKEEIKQRKKVYNKLNKEKLAVKNFEYRIQNKEKIAEQKKQYRQTLPYKVSMAKARIKYNNTHPEITIKLSDRKYVTRVLKPLILLRDNFACQLCKTQETKLIIHHILPVKYDTDNSKIKELTNLITLCKECHKIAHLNNWSKIDNNLALVFAQHIVTVK